MKKKLVFLTGSGISAESGLSTFRASNGLWNNEPVDRVATHEAWLRDPEYVNNFYNDLRHRLMAAQPNDAHRLVAELEEDFDVTVITQNVDNLHEQAGSHHVVHLHGDLMKVCSSNDVDDERYIEQMTPQRLEVQPGERAKDGSLLRPWIVFFGEAVPAIGVAADIVEEADILVVIGTSLVVYPAAGLLGYARPGVPVYLIDPADVEIPYGRKVTHLKQRASEGMMSLTKMLRQK